MSIWKKNQIQSKEYGLDSLNRVRTGSPINNGTVYNLDRYIIFLSLVIIK